MKKTKEKAEKKFSFPEEEWISLKTTNIIERLNKEFNVEQRRWKS